MSGEGLGYLFALPIIIGGAAIAGVGLAAYGIAKAGVYAGKTAYDYYKKKEQEREEILKSGIRSDLGMLHADVESALADMNDMGNKLYQDMEKEMFAKNSEMLEILHQADAEEYQKYLSGLQETQKDTFQKMKKLQDRFDHEYAQKVRTELTVIQENVNTHAENILDQIKNFQESDEKKEQFAADLAKKYLDETGKILKALVNGFDTRRLLPGIRDSLTKQMNDAIALYNKQNYEGAVAAAQTLQMDIGEKVYELEKAEIDWDTAYQAALSAVEMARIYLESQTCFDENAAEEIKKVTGVEIPEDLYDEELADYADRDADGRNTFLEIRYKIQELSKALRDEASKNMNVQELRELTEHILTSEYPQAMQTVQNAVMNMSNVFYRVQKANEFRDFLESKDFDVRLFFEDEDDLTSDIGLAVYNRPAREKVVYTLSKQKPGENPNQVNIVYQLAEGDEKNQARNQYYQDMIKDFTGAEIMTCNQATIGQTASDLTETAKEELKAFEQ